MDYMRFQNLYLKDGWNWNLKKKEYIPTEIFSSIPFAVYPFGIFCVHNMTKDY